MNYEDLYLGSYFGQIYFPPKKVAIFSLDAAGSPACLSLTGQVEYPDPFKVILKRIIMTGYPAKIYKRRAVICHMFFSPSDITAFSKNEVWTKNGLRGKIEDSVGTKGAMKVLFNQKLKGDDTVCMSLYKRVHPLYIYDN